MAKSYNELVKRAESTVTGIRDRELRKEAFKIILLQLMAGGGVSVSSAAPRTRKRATAKTAVRRKTAGRKTNKVATKASKKKAVRRPGRAGGGVVTTLLNKLLASGYFRTQRDAATVFKEFKKRRADILPSQLRMELLRFARSGKLKRKIKMKGRKVTYLYSK